MSFNEGKNKGIKLTTTSVMNLKENFNTSYYINPYPANVENMVSS
jgi:hypothetical protein